MAILMLNVLIKHIMLNELCSSRSLVGPVSLSSRFDLFDVSLK